MTEIKHAYKGEAQLIRWADSLSAGRTITLRLEEEGMLHPFKGIPAGQRMQIAAVLVNDDEQPIGPEEAKKNATRHKARIIPAKPEPVAEPEKAKTGRSSLAHLKCSETSFRDWLRQQNPTMWTQCYAEDEYDQATQVLKWMLGIKSRAELDKPGAAADAFDKLLTSYQYRNQVRA